MPSPRYLFTSDSDQLPVAPQLNIEDDSDGWWAGIQHAFVAVPLAGALAALALSASLAFGYQQQIEDIIPAPSPEVVEDEYWQVSTPAYPPVRLQLPYFHEDELPAGSLFGQPDEDFWRVETPPYPPPRFLYLPDPEELPTGALFGAPAEEEWLIYLPPYPFRPFPLTPWVADEDFAVTPAPGLGVEEDYWLPPPALLPSAVFQPWAVSEDVAEAPPPPPPPPVRVEAAPGLIVRPLKAQQFRYVSTVSLAVRPAALCGFLPAPRPPEPQAQEAPTAPEPTRHVCRAAGPLASLRASALVRASHRWLAEDDLWVQLLSLLRRRRP